VVGFSLIKEDYVPASAKVDRELAAVQLSKTGKDALSDDTAEAVEGQVVGKKEYDEVALKGKKFRVREKIGAMAMLKWSAASEMSTEDPRALGAIYAMLKSVIFREDWPAFEDHALDEDADAEELLDVITKALEVVSGRPTPPS
jgi:hypothetical protein